MNTDPLPEQPGTAELARLNRCAEELVRRCNDQLGYPFDQGVNLSGFYRWLADTGLADVTLINVGDPWKTSWDMLDTDEFERASLDFFADSFNFGGDHWGVLTNGGTDGNMHGIYFGRKFLASKSPLPPLLYVSEEAHYSVKKMADVQNLEPRLIPADAAGRMRVDKFAEMLDPNRPALIAVAVGGTFKGAIDDQDAIAQVLEEKKPVACYRHLDAALFGGYLAYLDDPAARRVVDAAAMKYDSIALSGHKFVGLNEPVGIFICRKNVMKALSDAPIAYLNCNMPTLSCSRSGFDALKLYWKIAVTGREGFRRQAKHVLEMTALLREELTRRGVPTMVNRWSNTVCFPRPSEPVIHKYAISCNDYPGLGSLAHVVVMQFFTPELAVRLADEIAASAPFYNEKHLRAVQTD
ncbi:MAG: aminotransferase class V-fold PLP-dependent enzyme [Victivallaceae bacterium]|nr:aminotransferase class V-fold PLP-dependent enzyme [Victivallaceae bacterium]